MDSLKNVMKEERKTYLSGSRTNIQSQKDIFNSFLSDSTLSKDSIENIIKFDLINIDDNKYPDNIEIKASVYDIKGNYISGLAKPYIDSNLNYKDFWVLVYDSCLGINHIIKDFDVKEIREKSAYSHAISFVIDHSASVGKEKIKKLQIAIKKLLTAVKPSDQWSIIQFAGFIINDDGLDFNNQSFSNFKVDSGENSIYKGGTSLFDAVITGINTLKDAPSDYKRVVIAFSDGFDNSSKAKIDTVMKFAKQMNTQIFTISYGFADPSLEKMAKYSGGRFYRTFSSNEFPFIFRDIYLSLKNYYLISYKPPDCSEIHTVKVNLNLNDSKIKKAASGTYDRSLFTELDPIGTTITTHIEFDFAKADVKEESMSIIEQIANVMKDQMNMEILITGHTDDIGSESSNMELSEKRAEAVKSKLISLGINSSRIKIKGMGESKPLKTNDSEENRKINRRTEFEIIKK
jgi:outer membrane protein OmpA-like peptidoglycan-associated protein/uncharacterized protein YegL